MMTVSGVALADQVEPVKPDEVSVWVEKNPTTQLVDVRTPQEQSQGRIEGAVSMPWADEDFLERAKAELKKDEPVLLICRTGRRSMAAGKALKELGFTKVLELDGGMIEYEKKKLPTVRP
jgi:rhodanese-related sulfurtransferase